MKLTSQITIALSTVALGALGGTALYAQDKAAPGKYALVSPGGIAFADFKGYEDWAVVSSARTDEVLKVIVGNPIIIKAFKSGIPGNGQPFPEGSRLAKLQWKPKKSSDAPFVVDVPDAFTQAFMMVKDSNKYPKTGGWGYAVFNYDAKSDKFSVDPTGVADCGHSCHVAVKSKDYVFHPYQER
jgi:Cytochrome P460